jgi:hypothetical protein
MTFWSGYLSSPPRGGSGLGTWHRTNCITVRPRRPPPLHSSTQPLSLPLLYPSHDRGGPVISAQDLGSEIRGEMMMRLRLFWFSRLRVDN